MKRKLEYAAYLTVVSYVHMLKRTRAVITLALIVLLIGIR